MALPGTPEDTLAPKERQPYHRQSYCSFLSWDSDALAFCLVPAIGVQGTRLIWVLITLCHTSYLKEQQGGRWTAGEPQHIFDQVQEMKSEP